MCDVTCALNERVDNNGVWTAFNSTHLISSANTCSGLLYPIRFHSSLYSTLITSVLVSSLLYCNLFSYYFSFSRLLPLYRLFVLPPNRQMTGLRLPSPSTVTMVQRHLEIKEFHMSQIGSNPVKVAVQYCHMCILSFLFKTVRCVVIGNNFLPPTFVFFQRHWAVSVQHISITQKFPETK